MLNKKIWIILLVVLLTYVSSPASKTYAEAGGGRFNSRTRFWNKPYVTNLSWIRTLSWISKRCRI
ncbi:hypothetical protein LJK88_43885 [Paenibacillus sp. P26]|nr:hypothetical protein LJK88_43885 [Paenibacillus sp. P26]UUZ92358.1 hypothetical protein LJK87_44425 [Paenibacillus sp. P25]